MISDIPVLVTQESPRFYISTFWVGEIFVLYFAAVYSVLFQTLARIWF